MWATIVRELRYLCKNKWDLFMVTFVPAFVIILLSSMFYAGKPQHLPVAFVDQDHSQLSRLIEERLDLNPTIQLIKVQDQAEADQLINKLKVWGFVNIPRNAEKNFIRGQDAMISVGYNQSFYSVGESISTAMQQSILGALIDYAKNHYLSTLIPRLDGPNLQISLITLNNPNLDYQLFLEPFALIAVLHLLLGCCVAFSVGQELLRGTLHEWSSINHVMRSVFAKNIVYVAIFCFWTWLWLFWMTDIQGWFIAGSTTLILLAQFFVYLAYAFISTTVVLVLQNLLRSFGVLTLYASSALSFAGVTLPLNNAVAFTKFWSMIIPFSYYQHLQTQQWLNNSALSISLIQLGYLILFCVIFFAISCVLLRKILKQGEQL